MLLCNAMGNIVGIDEVGRGSWAGPLLVVAARLTAQLPDNLRDSKLLTKQQRKAIFQALTTNFQFGEGWVQPEEIDEIGLARAMKLGVSRALMNLGVMVEDKIILDGIVNYCPEEFINVRTIAKADVTHPIVSAASIYAKVKRDDYMRRVSQFYPYYGFEKHVGYGTRLHQESLKIHGVSKIHRRSYRPVKAFLV